MSNSELMFEIINLFTNNNLITYGRNHPLRSLKRHI